jgi:hypothetical protein
MRFVLLGLLVGCMPPSDPGPQPDPPGWSDPNGPITGGCVKDTDCVGTDVVCSRDGSCASASTVRTVHVAWTLKGAAANAATCAAAPNLTLHFVAGTDGEWVGYAPVPCSEGKFTVDKLQSWYTRATLKKENDTTKQSGTFDETGNVTIDLPY